MALIALQDVDFSIGGPLLLEKVTLGIEPGERVCIVGRNGAGKSTLLKLLDGELHADDGEVRRQSGLRVARLAQEVPAATTGSIFDVVAAGTGEVGALLADYHHASVAEPFDAELHSALHARIDDAHGWTLEHRVETILSKLGLPEDQEFAALSGGMKRRVLLAQALAGAPDLLLLDEPTNHLDIETIAWMEEFLREFSGSIVFVTHDRRFLRELATRIVEIDRGQVTSWPGDYDNYLRRREERLHAEEQANALFDRKLAQEEVWIRQGIKARRTRNEGRVRALQALRRERAQRRDISGNVRMQQAATAASGKKVIEAEHVGFAYVDPSGNRKPIVRDFSTTILRGDRIGLIGPNGSGKTTLLRLLLGQLAPDSGQVRLGTNLSIAYFDQHRAQLREDWTALENVAEGRDFVDLGDTRKHVIGYLQDFLFTPERARAPITKLSGGERNRLLLAKLFAQPSNLLVLDEPTNDLDVETLELLEERVAAYPGTVLVVSHDRDFLDAVATGTLVLEGDGRVGDYVGGYSDWERQRSTPASAQPAPTRAAPSPKPTPVATPRRKLSFKEQRELDALPARIETLETTIAQMTAAMLEPEFFRQEAAEIVAANTRMAGLQAELEIAFARWESLEHPA
jgi:ATP-binding cassette subfamily F protein uup